MSDAPHPPPPPPPGWRPPTPHEPGTYNPAPQQGGHDPTRVLPPTQHRQYPDQRLHERATQPVEPKEKPPKWVWWVGGFVALAIIGALLPDTETDTGEESTAAIDEVEDTVEDTTTTTESTTTTEPSTSSSIDAAVEEQIEEELQLTDEEEAAIRGLAVEMLLRDKWPNLGEQYSIDPAPIDTLSDEVCEAFRGVDSQDEAAVMVALVYSDLPPILEPEFSGMGDFAEFIGTLVGATCPDVLDRLS